MDTELYQSVHQGDVEKALRQTCVCLIREKCLALQETWIRLLSVYGERMYHSQQTPLFYQLVVELKTILDQDDLPVKQALAFTTKLLLVFKRPFMTPRNTPKSSIQKLRTKVISYFPLDAQLTRSGKMKFQRFLPTDPEESAFAERIIVGLLQLCESNGAPGDLKDALEYLARKKLVLYTAPTLKPAIGGAPDPIMSPPPSADDPEDLVAYLWILLKVVKPLSFDETLESLYYYDYRPSYKNARLGFLYAMAFVSESSATSCVPVWNQTEQVFLNKVFENSLELWKEAKAATGGPPKKPPVDKQKLKVWEDDADDDDDGFGGYDDDDGFRGYDDRNFGGYTDDDAGVIKAFDAMSFVPRAEKPRVEEPVERDPVQTKKVAKVIHISKGKGRNRLIQRQENFRLNTQVDLDEDDQEDNMNSYREAPKKKIQTLAFTFIPTTRDDKAPQKYKEKEPSKDKGPTEKHIRLNGAPHRDSSGHRRFDIGETRSRTQNPYGSEDFIQSMDERDTILKRESGTVAKGYEHRRRP